MKKKSLIIAVVLSLITIFTIGSTLSYFTDKAEAVNTVKMGKVDIEIVEKITELGKEDVGVTNKGPNPAWIRIFVGLPKGIGGEDVYEVTFYTENSNGGSWAQEGEYYYYSVPIEPGNTASLFSSIMRSEAIEEDELPSNYDIIIYAEAVQVSLGVSAQEAFENLKLPKAERINNESY